MQSLKQQSEKLKSYIDRFDVNKAIPLWIFFFNCQTKTEGKFIQLTSIARQMAYLINLSLSNHRKGKDSIYSLSEIMEMLENIEESYKEQYNFNEVVDYYGEIYRKNLVAQSTYLNYYVNTPLVYVEQVIERIQGTFSKLDNYINSSLGVGVNDLIMFYYETEQMSSLKFMECYSNFTSQNVSKNADGIYCYTSSEKDNDVKFISFDLVNQQTFSIDDYKMIDKSKAEVILSLLSIKQASDSNYLYYTDFCELLNKPIIQILDNRYILFFSNQLILSIYNLLYNICKDKSGKDSDRARSLYLEKKTIDVFTEFLPENEVKIYKNYYINGQDKEKDILIFHRRNAFIIECKSDLYKEPFRSIDKSYKRIEREFKTSIQKAYEQAKEVKHAICHNKELAITDKNANLIECIKINRIENTFIILVTQERFGQIQCDLGLLLEKEEDEFYPWSVSIDDLESILLTLSRKDNSVGELFTFMINREKLHERLICFDELDIVGYFIMQKQLFIQECNREEVFIASPDVCDLFDNFYRYGGFGFKNEINLKAKFRVSIPAYIVYRLCNKLKIKEHIRIIEFKKKYNINNKAMTEFKIDFNNVYRILKKHPEKKELFKQILEL